ncbi:Heat shock protein 70, partial [mine drainage metagenome]
EVERMVKEAEANAEEDRKRAEEVTLRNRCDSLVYSSEKTMREHGDKLTAELKAEIEEKVEALKTAIAAKNVVDMQSREQELSAVIQKSWRSGLCQHGHARG